MQIIVALDLPSPGGILELSQKLDPGKCFVKLGLEGFIAGGPELVKKIHQQGHEIFLDLKLDDIPTTIAHAITQISGLGVWGTTIHTKTGVKGLIAADIAADDAHHPLNLFGVTVLTSMDVNDLSGIGVNMGVSEYVGYLASTAWKCGLDGVVCSVRDVARLKEEINTYGTVVCPGIRMEQPKDDQVRTATIDEALEVDVDYAVIGREITRADDPTKALDRIYEACKY